MLNALFDVQIHANKHSFVGAQCVYVILFNDQIFKFGKAKMDNWNKKKDLPERTVRQINNYRKQFPLLEVEGFVIYRNSQISTEDIEAKETSYIQDYVNKQPKNLCPEARLPEGNQGHKNKIDFKQ
ncbi:MAG: hypothetical protein EAZ97_01520 [Bacteroidetes bacterium]|nr:MAG: hypothetical protein EAZ97_01520 [Bacteroidota bacterium]